VRRLLVGGKRSHRRLPRQNGADNFRLTKQMFVKDVERAFTRINKRCTLIFVILCNSLKAETAQLMSVDDCRIVDVFVWYQKRLHVCH